MRGLITRDSLCYHRHTTAIESTHERMLTVTEVAERLHVHPITVRRLIKAGKLPAVRVGRAVRVRASEVDAFGERARPEQRRREVTPEEWEERRRVAEETLARRDARGPIGISTLELVRASRRELEDRGERQ